MGFDDLRTLRDDLVGGQRVTTGREVPFCMFTDPEPGWIGLSETEAIERGIANLHQPTPYTRRDERSNKTLCKSEM